MLELAACGARVLMLRSVEYARNHGVKLHVRSSFNDEEGTWIVKEEDVLEQAIISGIAHDTGEAKVTIRGVPDQPGVAGRVFRPLADAGINIDMIVQNTSDRGPHGHLVHAARGRRCSAPSRCSSDLADAVGAGGFTCDPDIAKVSVDRRRDEEPPGRRGGHLRGARRRGDQHRDHLDVVDPRLLRRAARATPSGP